MSRALAVYHGPFGRAALYALDRPFATHAHREGHLVFHVGGMPGVFPVDGIDYSIAPGQGAALSPWEPHGFRSLTLGEASVCLVLYIRGDWFTEMAVDGAPGLRFGRCHVEVTGRIARDVERVTAHLLDSCQPASLTGHLYELTSECFERSWQGSEPCDRLAAVSRQPAAPSDFRVRRSIQLMRERLGSELLLDRVARDAGLSRAHFFKLFRRQTGITPNIFLNTLRMERAIECLTQSTRSVTEIGVDLGFSSQASFTRFFSANVGIAPSDYRRTALA